MKSFIQEQGDRLREQYVNYEKGYDGHVIPLFNAQGMDLEDFCKSSLLELEKRLVEEMEKLHKDGLSFKIEGYNQALDDCQQLTKKLISGN